MEISRTSSDSWTESASSRGVANAHYSVIMAVMFYRRMGEGGGLGAGSG